MTEMQTTFRTGDPAELVAHVAYALGFAPSESLALLSVRPGGRTGLIARIDLSDVGTHLLQDITRALVNDGAERVVIVAYSVDAFAAMDALDAARAAVGEADLTPTLRLIVGVTDVMDADSGHTVSLSEVAGTYVAAVNEAAGRTVAHSREDVLATTATASACAAAAKAREGYKAPGPVAQMNVWRRALAGQESGPAAYGRIAAILSATPLRDAVLVSATSRATTVLVNDVAKGVDGCDAGVARAMAEILSPLEGRKPGEAVEPALALLQEVIAHNPGHCTAALTLWGLLEWWSGRSARASIALTKALEQDPTYRLANLGMDALDAGLPPGWVTSRR